MDTGQFFSDIFADKKMGSLLLLGVLTVLIGTVLFLFSANKILQFGQTSTLEVIQTDEVNPDVPQATQSGNVKEVTVVTVTVDVAGAVQKPGVYTLSSELRIKDVIDAAGGFSTNADTQYIAEQLNLASLVSDELKIYIPKKGEVLSSSTTQTTTSSSRNNSININKASESELDSLKGVGVVTAQKIIDGRPYQSIDELLTKKIVGQKVFDDIKDQIGTK